MMIFLFVFYMLPETFLSGVGDNSDMWYLSITLYTGIVFAVDTKLALTTRYWTWINALCITVLSIGVYVAYQFVYDPKTPLDSQYTIDELYKTA